MNVISRNPPSPVSFMLTVSVLYFIISAYIVYIRYRTPANSAASSPPAPALISIMTFFSSIGSFGRSSIFSSSSNFAASALEFFSSSSAISRSSGSFSVSSRARASSASLRAFLYSLYFSITGARFALSFMSEVKRSISCIVSGFASSDSIFSNRFSASFSLSSINTSVIIKRIIRCMGQEASDLRLIFRLAEKRD